MSEHLKRKVKIVCTLGPATKDESAVSRLVEAGLDVCRLNFSHGDHAFHRAIYGTVREVSRQSGRHITIMQDLQGPKFRVGILPGGSLDLKAGDTLLLYAEGGEIPPMPGAIAVPILAESAHAVLRAVRSGAPILFNDGLIQAVVGKVGKTSITADVSAGGKLTSHKGINLPGTPVELSSLTEKDKVDLRLGLELGVDAVALSFVRSAADVEELRKAIRSQTHREPWIVSKIERPEAIDHLDSIIAVSDCVLVARGDMAVEIGAGRVPMIQKRIISACNELGVPVITATQMLESMILSPSPTRAEASDVANAVFDGTDAVMLSAETATGRYAVEAVRTMARFIQQAEDAKQYAKNRGAQPIPGSVVDSIEFSASRVAHHVGAVAIACLTHTGTAARTLAKYRPGTPIVAIMDNEELLCRLGLVWGVRGVVIAEILGTDDLFAMVEKVLKENQFAKNGDLVVVTAGVPTLRRGTTNMIKVHCVGSRIDES